MTLDQLKDQLNKLRVDPAWKDGWVRRGADFGAVLRCIRDRLELAAKQQQLDNDAAVQGWIKHILDYAAYKHWDEQASKPIPALPPDPEIFSAQAAAATFAGQQPARSTLTEAKAAWVRFLECVNPDKTFGQARVLYFRQTTRWPEWNWPGMPRSRIDRLARIRDVPAARRFPTPGNAEQR